MSLQLQPVEQNGTLKHLLMVETRSIWEASDVQDFLCLPQRFLTAGVEVDLFLIQNSVLLLRSALRDTLAELAKTDACRIWLDHYSLNLRGLTAQDAAGCGAIAGTDELVKLMTVPHTKIIWHS